MRERQGVGPPSWCSKIEHPHLSSQAKTNFYVENVTLIHEPPQYNHNLQPQIQNMIIDEQQQCVAMRHHPRIVNVIELKTDPPDPISISQNLGTISITKESPKESTNLFNTIDSNKETQKEKETSKKDINANTYPKFAWRPFEKLLKDKPPDLVDEIEEMKNSYHIVPGFRQTIRTEEKFFKSLAKVRLKFPKLWIPLKNIVEDQLKLFEEEVPAKHKEKVATDRHKIMSYMKELDSAGQERDEFYERAFLLCFGDNRKGRKQIRNFFVLEVKREEKAQEEKNL